VVSDPVYQRLVTALLELQAHADHALRTTGQRAGVPLFVPSVAKRVKEIIDPALASLASPPPDEPPRKHYIGAFDGGACGKRTKERGTAAYEWAYVTCPDCLATRAAPPDEPEAHPREDERSKCVHCGGPNAIICNRCYGMVAYARPGLGEARTAPEPAKEPQG